MGAVRRDASRTKSVAVIGGGVVGMAIALSLQDRGIAVTVADAQGVNPPASWGNAGRIAVELNEPLSSLATLRFLPGQLFSVGGPVSFPVGAISSWLPFGLRVLAASMPRRAARGTQALGALLSWALPAWRELLGRINAADQLVETGHYSVWENERKFAAGRAAWFRNAGAATPSDMGGTELERLRMLVATPIAGAVKFAGTASIADPTELQKVMRNAFLAKGGRLKVGRVTVDEANHCAECVVVAGGIESAQLLQEHGHIVPLIAERGYHIQQDGSVWPTDLPSIFFEDRSVVLTQFRSALRATSFVEFTRHDAPPDPRKWSRLRRHARELGLPFDDRSTQWYGSRPTLPDYLPAIGRSTIQGNLYYAFGHQHLGLTLAAITGELMAGLIGEDAGFLDLAPFDIERFHR